jgi:DNA-binding NarL/FixJ family response regulator
MKTAVSTGREPPRHDTVLVGDNHVLVRDGVKMLVASILGHIQFVEAEDGDALVNAAKVSDSVDLALVDPRMPGMHGGQRLIELAHFHPNTPVIIVSALRSAEVVRRLMGLSNVCAFVPKDAPRSELRAAIESALRGRKNPRGNAGRTTLELDAGLTPRQQEIRALLRRGLSNKMIARELGITEGTVKNHLSEIFRTLNAANRTQAAQFSFEVE